MLYNFEEDEYKFKEKSKYAYAVGVIRVFEMRLFTQSDLQRLLEAPSPEEALEILRDSPYENSLNELESVWDFDLALNNELERSYRLIDDLSLDKELTNLFRAKWDFYNLKVLLKQSYLESAEEFPFISNLGMISPEKIKTAIDSEEGHSIIDDLFGKMDGLPTHLQVAMDEAKEVYDTENDPQMIDIIIDRHTQAYLYHHSLGCPFLANYFKRNIDLANIRNFIRIKLLQQNFELLQKVLLDNGIIDKQTFINEFKEEDVLHLANVLSPTPYFSIVDEGLREWSETGSLTTFEKMAEDYLIKYLKPAKYQSFGVEPLIAYLLAKENEIKQVRIIMVGKLNRLPEDSILERLRVSYV